MTTDGTPAGQNTAPETTTLGEATTPTEPTTTNQAAAPDNDIERRRLAREKKNERMVWWYLAYFLFGIHLVAFIMIYAVTHAK